MGEIDEILEEYEKFSNLQFSELNDLKTKISFQIFKLDSSLGVKQSKEFSEIITNLKTYRYLLCEELIKFILNYKNN